MAIILQSPAGNASANIVLVGGVTWDNTGCSILTGECPAIPAFENLGNVSVGVDLIGNNLTALATSGLPGQGTCVNPVVSQSEGFFYWEVTWTELSDPNMQVGIGVIEISSIPNWDALAATGAGGCIVRPNGDLWRDGDFFPASGGSGFAPQVAGDTIGIFINLTTTPGNTIAFYGVGGSILNQSTPATGLNLSISGTRGSFVPAVAFDDAPLEALLAVTANFGAGGLSSFLGPSVLNPLFFNGVTLGWPNKP